MFAESSPDSMQCLPARAGVSMTGRLARVWWLLLLGALQCKRAFAKSFSSGNKLQVAVNKVVAGSWSGDDISLWDVSGVDDMGFLFCGYSCSGDSWCQNCSAVKGQFNADLSKWEVSGVTTMRCVCVWPGESSAAPMRAGLRPALTPRLRSRSCDAACAAPCSLAPTHLTGTSPSGTCRG